MIWRICAVKPQPTNLVVIRLVKILTPTVRNGFLGNTSGEPSLAHDDNENSRIQQGKENTAVNMSVRLFAQILPVRSSEKVTDLSVRLTELLPKDFSFSFS